MIDSIKRSNRILKIEPIYPINNHKKQESNTSNKYKKNNEDNLLFNEILKKEMEKYNL